LKTGYFIKKFEQKKKPSSGGIKREDDVSELTLQHEGEDPIVMVLNRIAEQREPLARVVCKGNAQIVEVRRGQRFDCGETAYNVVDITLKQMIIIDVKSGERHEIPLSAPKK